MLGTEQVVSCCATQVRRSVAFFSCLLFCFSQSIYKVLKHNCMLAVLGVINSNYIARQREKHILKFERIKVVIFSRCFCKKLFPISLSFQTELSLKVSYSFLVYVFIVTQTGLSVIVFNYVLFSLSWLFNFFPSFSLIISL